MDKDTNPEEFVKNLLTEEALHQPSDTCKPAEIETQLPEWFDEDQFNKARHFYWDNCFMLSSSMMLGLLAVFAVPSILKVLIGSRRSTSVYTAYYRYLSTLLHTVSWFEHELKPGTTSWKSLHTVRSRHLAASLASKLKGAGVVSQRDIALTQFGFIGFATLKPDHFGIRQLEEGQLEAYNYFWRVIGHMLGLEDRYNICRKTFAETREVCQLLQAKVFMPCLENVPEYFEHMSRVMLEGMSTVNPTTNIDAFLFLVRYLADVPGYVLKEDERRTMQGKIKQYLDEKQLPLDTGVDTSVFMSAPAVDGLPPRTNRLLYYKDYEILETTPPYKRLNFFSRWRLGGLAILTSLYTTYLGRLYFNLNFKFSLWLMKYLPYLAFLKFGIWKSYVKVFKESPMDESLPKSNSEYYKNPPVVPWYRAWVDLF